VASLLAQVALYGLAAAAAAPIAAVLTALVLGKSKRPLVSAWALTAGAAFLDVVLAVAVLASGILSGGGDVGAYFDVALGVIMAVIGVMAVFSTESVQKEAARQARADRIATAGPATLFTAGIFVQVVNFDAIAVFGGAVKEIAAADVTTAEAVVAFVFGLALMLSVYYVPALVYAVVPARAAGLLGGMTGWILRNSRAVEIVTGLGFGVLFLWKGLAVLV
jgi:hypothetical protein